MREIQSKLWIGNARDARDVPSVLNTGIEAIIDLALEEPPISLTREIIYCRIPILDGAENSSQCIKLAIEVICNLLESEVSILVACSAGMSRSPVMVAAALSRLQNISFDKALSDVTLSGPCDISPALANDVVRVLNSMKKDRI